MQSAPIVDRLECRALDHERYAQRQKEREAERERRDAEDEQDCMRLAGSSCAGGHDHDSG